MGSAVEVMVKGNILTEWSLISWNSLKKALTHSDTNNFLLETAVYILHHLEISYTEVLFGCIRSVFKFTLSQCWLWQLVEHHESKVCPSSPNTFIHLKLMLGDVYPVQPIMNYRCAPLVIQRKEDLKLNLFADRWIKHFQMDWSGLVADQSLRQVRTYRMVWHN